MPTFPSLVKVGVQPKLQVRHLLIALLCGGAARPSAPAANLLQRAHARPVVTVSAGNFFHPRSPGPVSLQNHSSHTEDFVKMGYYINMNMGLFDKHRLTSTGTATEDHAHAVSLQPVAFSH